MIVRDAQGNVTAFILDDGSHLPIIVHPPQTLADVHAAIARVNEPIHRANSFRNRRRKRR